MSEKFFRKGPQNAAKNKPHIPTDAELASVPASDERKTVILDEDLEGVDLEDRVWLYWKRNRNFIIFTIVAAFAIVIGVQGWKMYKASSGDTLAAAYAAANTPEKLAEFAKAHSGTTLAGVAQLQNADTAFNAGKFADAQKLYSEAAKNLGEETLAGRAKIGMAMSAISAIRQQAWRPSKRFTKKAPCIPPRLDICWGSQKSKTEKLTRQRTYSKRFQATIITGYLPCLQIKSFQI